MNFSVVMFKGRINNQFILFRRLLFNKKTSNSNINIEEIEKESVVIEPEVNEFEKRLTEEEIQKKCNKSRLKETDRNILNEIVPWPETTYSYQETLKYKRRLYGRYGSSSGVDPSLCWPIKEELKDSKEYEKIAFPYTIPEIVEQAKQQRHEKNEKIRKRQEDIVNKVKKLDMWKKELANKIAKKEAEVKVAKEKRERLMEEVRAHFGYTVDPRDDKFKELLEKKEKEQKKLAKEARKKEREQQLLAKLLSKKTVSKE